MTRGRKWKGERVIPAIAEKSPIADERKWKGEPYLLNEEGWGSCLGDSVLSLCIDPFSKPSAPPLKNHPTPTKTPIKIRCFWLSHHPPITTPPPRSTPADRFKVLIIIVTVKGERKAGSFKLFKQIRVSFGGATFETHHYRHPVNRPGCLAHNFLG